MFRSARSRALLIALLAFLAAEVIGGVQRARALGTSQIAVAGGYQWDHYTYNGQGQITGCVYYYTPDLCSVSDNIHYSCDETTTKNYTIATSGYANGACGALSINTSGAYTWRLITVVHR